MATAVNLDQSTLHNLDEPIARGRFASREDVVREGLRLVHEQDWMNEAVNLGSLNPETRDEIEAGLADVAAGRVEDADVGFARLHERYANRPRAAG